MGHFLAALLSKLCADEVEAWLPAIADRLTRAAVCRLPEDERERYSEEWRSHLNEVPGALARVWVACGFLSAATQMPSRISAFALYLACVPLIALVRGISNLNERGMYTFPLSYLVRIGDMDSDTVHHFRTVLHFSCECVRLDIWVKSREIPLARLLHESLDLKLPLSRIYEKKTHYAFWRPSFLYALDEYVEDKRLNHFLLLSTVMSGRMSLRSWFESVLGKEDSREQQETNIKRQNTVTIKMRDRDR